ncbi:DDE-type integrase/transposase/recombinase [Gandjariella thermophila]
MACTGRGSYGGQLNREGIGVARCTVERLMRELGISGVTASRKRPRTTLPGRDLPDDLLEGDFTADAPNLRWVADITYVATAAGWVYTGFVQDLFSRRIDGWQVADHLGADLARHSAGRHLPKPTTITYDHSNQPVLRRSLEPGQYTSIRYVGRLDQVGAARSVGSKGDSYDMFYGERITESVIQAGLITSK